ncbi:MAG: transporter substrate-binding domain-containing protein [Proteobacteria bacterium]|nr:transporter substrate-binding domain-containing protein [Pseudomonadota bacterium]
MILKVFLRRTLTLALILAPFCHAMDQATLSVTGSIWSPYIDQTLPNNGLAAELVSTALKRAGYSIKPTVEPWSRAYQGASIGIYDVLAAVWRTDQRAELLEFSEPYLFNDIIIIARAGIGARFTKLDDLTGFRIGVVEGYAYGGGFDEFNGAVRVSNHHLIQNLLLLDQGKIDMVIGDSWSIQHAITVYLPDAPKNWTLMPKLVTRRALHVGVSKANKNAAEIIKAINASFVQMRQDESYLEIVTRHTGDYVMLPVKS